MKEKLLHGKANEPFLQRKDWKLKDKGVKSESKSKEREIPPTVRSCLAAEVDADSALESMGQKTAASLVTCYHR